ncbi:MAG: septum formation initiator family protein [bacterium]
MLVYFVVLIRNDLVRDDILNKEKAAITKNLDVQAAKQAALKNELKMLNRNSHIEMLAREKLGIVQHGEKAYKVIIKE